MQDNQSSTDSKHCTAGRSEPPNPIYSKIKSSSFFLFCLTKLYVLKGQQWVQNYNGTNTSISVLHL